MVREIGLGRRRGFVLTLVLVLAGVAPLGACLGCGVASTTGPQAAASTTTPASVITDETTSPGSPANVPAVGSSVTLESMTEAAIPTGRLIEELRSDPSDRRPLRLVIDPRAHKGFREMTTSDNVPYPGFDFMIFDEGGHSEMGETNLEIGPYNGADFAQIVGLYDNLSDKTGEVTGHGTVEGRQTFVAKTTLIFGAEEGGGGTIDVTATVDPVTNLIVREEWRVQGVLEQTVERHVIEATPELLYRMDVKNMNEIVAGYQQVRQNGLKDVPFPVYGLPAGYADLPLTWIIPHPDKGMVRLQYGKPQGDNNYIAVTTLDPKKYPNYGEQYLGPLDQACVDPEDEGDLTEMRFGIGDVGVQIQARKDIIRQVARDLVIVGGPRASTSGLAFVSTTVPATQQTLASVDRHDPESVLRAYFSAWQNADWEGEASFMAEMFAHMVPEPAKSLRIVDLRRVEGSASRCLYAVAFDFAPQGDVISMEAGRYDWTYDLNWDQGRQSWVITNYGEG
jgi:hypothetical protein